MIGWADVYKVVEAMTPLYVALLLGYASVKWWRVFTPEQTEAVNRFVCYFTMPLFTFEFAAHVDPFNMNYPFMAADVISKVIIVLVLACWAKWSSKGSYCWSITSFSLSTLTNSLVVGVPLLKAMYGVMAMDLVVQSSVFQALVWLTLLLFVLEIRRTTYDYYFHDGLDDGVVKIKTNGSTPDVSTTASTIMRSLEEAKTVNVSENRPSLWKLVKVVWLKLAMNPNSYACIIGITWAFLSNRYTTVS